MTTPHAYARTAARIFGTDHLAVSSTRARKRRLASRPGKCTSNDKPRRAGGRAARPSRGAPAASGTTRQGGPSPLKPLPRGSRRGRLQGRPSWPPGGSWRYPVPGARDVGPNAPAAASEPPARTPLRTSPPPLSGPEAGARRRDGHVQAARLDTTNILRPDIPLGAAAGGTTPKQTRQARRNARTPDWAPPPHHPARHPSPHHTDAPAPPPPVDVEGRPPRSARGRTTEQPSLVGAGPTGRAAWASTTDWHGRGATPPGGSCSSSDRDVSSEWSVTRPSDARGDPRRGRPGPETSRTRAPFARSPVAASPPGSGRGGPDALEETPPPIVTNARLFRARTPADRGHPPESATYFSLRPTTPPPHPSAVRR